MSDRLLGNDVLTGGDGNDTLRGGGGSDLITGGAGSDALIGGVGLDRFNYNTITDSLGGQGNRDVIQDFRAGQGDQIDLSRIDAVTGGNDDTFTYIGDKAFDGVAGQLHFVNGILSGDVNGDAVADFEISLVGVNSLAVTDFVL